MNADHLSYQRATSVSIIGLVVQLVLGLALLLYGIFGSDPTAKVGAFVVFFGVPVWIALALVFHQHKRERIEATENEAYRASGAAASSVFGDDQPAETVQADKLAWMHRFFLPAISLVLAAAYLTTGLLRFGGDMTNAKAEDFTAPTTQGVAISVGVALLVVFFILARFVAGMAKQKMWSLLHAGAAASVGSALIGALLLAAHGLEMGINFDGLLRSGPVVIDALMVFLGAEIVLNFILTVYRPRKAGEYLRPAFDSRLLAFLAAPDRLAESVSEAINYQLGFDVSSTWFYRLVSRSLLGLGILTVVTLWGMTCFAVVQPDEKGLLLAGGEFVEELESGMVLKRPWPFANVETFPADAVSSFEVGLPMLREDLSKPLLWTDDNPSASNFLIAQASPGTAGDDPVLLVGEVPVQYTVTHLRNYMGLAQDGPESDPEQMREGVLRSSANAVVTRFFLGHTIDELLGPERDRLERELRAELQNRFDALETTCGAGAGVRVLFAGLHGVRPPNQTAGEFERVNASVYAKEDFAEKARAERIRTLSGAVGTVDLADDVVGALDRLAHARDGIGPDPNEAERIEIEALEQEVADLLTSAGGSAAVGVIEARGKRWTRHMGERARSVLAEGRNAGFRAAPGVYRIRLWVEALRDSAKDARVWISPIPLSIRLNNESAANDFSTLDLGSTSSSGQE